MSNSLPSRLSVQVYAEHLDAGSGVFNAQSSDTQFPNMAIAGIGLTASTGLRKPIKRQRSLTVVNVAGWKDTVTLQGY